MTIHNKEKNFNTNHHEHNEPHEKIVIEIKAVSKINDQHKAQLTNYLAATGYRLGLLVNFNSFPIAEIIRMVR